MIGCIFAENGPLEGGIESSFRGTGWGAKGDFIRYSYLYPYIFESRTHTFFESTCPELYAQQSWEWSDVYSRRMGRFSKGAPHHFPKAHALRYGHRKFGDDHIFAENGPLEGGIEARYSGTGWGAKGDFRWIFGLHPYIFEGGPHHFPKAHALRYRHRKFGDDRMYIRGEWAPRRWHWIKFQGYRLGC